MTRICHEHCPAGRNSPAAVIIALALAAAAITASAAILAVLHAALAAVLVIECAAGAAGALFLVRIRRRERGTVLMPWLEEQDESTAPAALPAPARLAIEAPRQQIDLPRQHAEHGHSGRNR